MKYIAMSVVLAVAVGQASAEFVTPAQFGWNRGDANSGYWAWDRFASLAGASPDVATNYAGPGNGAITSGTGQGTFLTSGGNYYNVFGITGLVGSVPNFGLGAGSGTTLLLQVRTVGTEIAPATVLVTPVGGVATAAVETRELFRQNLGGAPGSPGSGFIVDVLFRFTFSENASGYGFSFAAAEGSMSIDRVSVDTFAIPAPGAGALLGAGLMALARRRRA